MLFKDRQWAKPANNEKFCLKIQPGQFAAAFRERNQKERPVEGLSEFGLVPEALQVRNSLRTATREKGI